VQIWLARRSFPFWGEEGAFQQLRIGPFRGLASEVGYQVMGLLVQLVGSGDWNQEKQEWAKAQGHSCVCSTLDANAVCKDPQCAPVTEPLYVFKAFNPDVVLIRVPITAAAEFATTERLILKIREAAEDLRRERLPLIAIVVKHTGFERIAKSLHVRFAADNVSGILQLLDEAVIIIENEKKGPLLSSSHT
jgi:hypothetical protein